MASFKGQRTLIDFDGKQKSLDSYVEWIYDEEDPDDDGNSYESCYRLNRVE